MLILTPRGRSGVRILLVLQFSFDASEVRYLWAEVDAAHLWRESFAKHLPYGAHAYLLDVQGQTIYESFEVPASLRQFVLTGLKQKDRGHFDHTIDGEAHYGSYRSILLQQQFLATNWAVVVVQQKFELTRTIDEFKRIFPLAIFVALGVVVLLSINLIRSSLVPLKNLITGTNRIARKDFSGRIEVSSNDEFNDLALSFNHMSSQLDRQFRAITASADVDRAILSNLDPDGIAGAIIDGINQIFHCDRIGIGILATDAPDRVKTFTQRPAEPIRSAIHTGWENIDHGQIIGQLTEDAWMVPYEGADSPGFLASFKEADILYQAVVPVRIQKQLAAFIVLGYARYAPACEVHFEHARKMADQMAVALANASLCRQLDQSHWGALHALARAVDAKSPWTAGHTERVAHTAQAIGEALGLDAAALDNLHRGGLLHDLGKIGVSAAILDKPGPLTDKEFTTIKSHPSIGARILEPIAAFKEVIPIVEQHHERFDGKGYPLGLKGEAIDFCARILSVADAFDALRSSRPYRDGLPFEKAMAMIEEGAGSQYDPRIVAAFVSLHPPSAPKATDARHQTVNDNRAMCSVIDFAGQKQKRALKEIRS